MGCMLWGSCSDVIHQSEFEPTGDTPCFALRDELWGDCCEDTFVMQYINQILNSKGTPHVSPLRTSHEVSVMRILLRCNTLIRIWTHNGHLMHCPYGRANVCLCWGVMTLNINQIMNSLVMPHVSPRWMSHGVSVVMILVNIDNVMATPQFIFQQHMQRRTINP